MSQGQGLGINEQIAGVRIEGADEHAARCTLARAIRADEADYLTGLEHHGKVVQNRRARVRLG
jgi:hypothetical protein